MTRFCPKCQSETERSARGDCKHCCKVASAAYRASNPERIKAAKAAYRAENHEMVKAAGAVYYAANIEKKRAYSVAWASANIARKKESDAAWYSANTERKKAYAEAWMAANPERAKAAAAAYRKANPEAMRVHHQNRRARKRSNGGTLSKGLSANLFRLQKGKCPCCAQPLGDDFHLDHKMPLSLGGSNTDDNMQLLRAKCNLQKRASHPVDFMQTRGFLL